MSFLRALLDGNEREVAKLRKIAAAINDNEAQIQSLSDEGLREKTDEFRARLKPFSERIDEVRAGRSEAIDPAAKAAVEVQVKAAYDALEAELMVILPMAFAVVREASRRTLHMRHYDVQMMAGTVLHMGRVAELATGEGKTLAATSPMYLNALTGKPAHLVTTNDYLAKRDATWMAPLFSLLGLSIGVIQGASSQHPHGSAWLYTPGYSDDDPAMQDLKLVHRSECYQCDLIYGTNAEFGFDYLRDNMARGADEVVQSDLHFAIVDEMDSILIDEARTPLIISGMPEQTSELYYRVDRVVARLEKERDYTVDEKAKNAMTTDEGIHRIEEGLGVANLADDVTLMHHVNAALRARYAYRKDIEYVVKEGQVIIVDEYTGRLMFGRRYSDGLHQAIEAKEGVRVEEETQTVATITIQNYFRLYHKLAGMTGTAKTEEQEIRKIYGMDVVVVPTNLPMIRKDLSDVVYKTEEQKFRAIVLEVLGKHVLGQPVLLGTRSIETSERLSERIGIGERLQLQALIVLLREKLVTTKGLPKDEVEQAHQLMNTKLDDLYIDKLKPAAKLANLTLDALDEGNVRMLKDLLGLEVDEAGHEILRDALRDGIPHSVLNAKHHEREGQIIADAGRKHAITIATNMAGRGVDIMLGGHREMDDPEEPVQVALSSGVTKVYPTQVSAEVAKLGGLAIVGSERHESRRIDRQLRGRSGRQGDPGESRFFLSLEDELWRLFGDRGKAFLGGWQEWEPLEARILSGAIQRAQKKVEEHHFGQRKNTLEYDDVMNVHRDVIYKQRREILHGADLRETVLDHTYDMIEVAVTRHCGAEIPQEEWDLRGLFDEMDLLFDLGLHAKPAELEGQSQSELSDFLYALAEKRYEQKEAEFSEMGVDIREAERHIALQVIDQKWVEHLNAMDYLREGVWMRGFEQRDPLVIYKKEAFDMFNNLLNSIQDDMVNWMFHLVLRQQAPPPPRRTLLTTIEDEDDSVEAPAAPSSNGIGRRAPIGAGGAANRIGRNDPCPCGSGKRYKFCCLKTGAL